MYPMIKRTTIELDEDLLARAKRALGGTTTRWTVEEALRRASAASEDEQERWKEKQRHFLETAHEHVDLDVLASDEMWR